MDNQFDSKEIARSLSFEVEAIPQDNTIQLTSSTNNNSPLNVKIKVRKKKDLDSPQDAVLSIPRIGKPGAKPERIRLASSDQTILSFNVMMEEANENKSPKKQKRKLFGLFKSGGALDSPQSNSENEILSENLTSIKTEDDVDIATSRKDRSKGIFGRSKPGGCLDPPFGEDRYAYEAVKNNMQTTSAPYKEIKLKETDSTSIKSSHSAKKMKTKSSLEDGIGEKSSKIKKGSILNLYQSESFKPSVEMSYSNSIITYPPPLTSSEMRVFNEVNEKNIKNKLSIDRSSFQEPTERYFGPKRNSNSQKVSNVEGHKEGTEELILPSGQIHLFKSSDEDRVERDQNPNTKDNLRHEILKDVVLPVAGGVIATSILKPNSKEQIHEIEVIKMESTDLDDAVDSKCSLDEESIKVEKNTDLAKERIGKNVIEEPTIVTENIIGLPTLQSQEKENVPIINENKAFENEKILKDEQESANKYKIQKDAMLVDTEDFINSSTITLQSKGTLKQDGIIVAQHIDVNDINKDLDIENENIPKIQQALIENKDDVTNEILKDTILPIAGGLIASTPIQTHSEHTLKQEKDIGIDDTGIDDVVDNEIVSPKQKQKLQEDITNHVETNTEELQKEKISSSILSKSPHLLSSKSNDSFTHDESFKKIQNLSLVESNKDIHEILLRPSQVSRHEDSILIPVTPKSEDYKSNISSVPVSIATSNDISYFNEKLSNALYSNAIDKTLESKERIESENTKFNFNNKNAEVRNEVSDDDEDKSVENKMQGTSASELTIKSEIPASSEKTPQQDMTNTFESQQEIRSIHEDFLLDQPSEIPASPEKTPQQDMTNTFESQQQVQSVDEGFLLDQPSEIPASPEKTSQQHMANTFKSQQEIQSIDEDFLLDQPSEIAASPVETPQQPMTNTYESQQQIQSIDEDFLLDQPSEIAASPVETPQQPMTNTFESQQQIQSIYEDFLLDKPSEIPAPPVEIPQQHMTNTYKSQQQIQSIDEDFLLDQPSEIAASPVETPQQPMTNTFESQQQIQSIDEDFMLDQPTLTNLEIDRFPIKNFLRSSPDQPEEKDDDKTRPEFEISIAKEEKEEVKKDHEDEPKDEIKYEKQENKLKIDVKKHQVPTEKFISTLENLTPLTPEPRYELETRKESIHSFHHQFPDNNHVKFPSQDVGDIYSRTKKNTKEDVTRSNTIPRLKEKENLHRNDVIILDVAFQSYMNENDNRVFRSVDTTKTFERFENDRIMSIKSTVKPEEMEMRLPIDDENDLSLSILKKDNTSFKSPIPLKLAKPSKLIVESYNNEKFDEPSDDGKYKLQKGLQKLDQKPEENPIKRHEEVKKQPELKLVTLSGQKTDDLTSVAKHETTKLPDSTTLTVTNINTLHHTLSSVYEKQLVPLQVLMKNLKEEIDSLASEQKLLRQNLIGVTKMKSMKIHVTKKCVCHRKY